MRKKELRERVTVDTPVPIEERYGLTDGDRKNALDGLREIIENRGQGLTRAVELILEVDKMALAERELEVKRLAASKTPMMILNAQDVLVQIANMQKELE